MTIPSSFFDKAALSQAVSRDNTAYRYYTFDFGGLNDPLFMNLNQEYSIAFYNVSDLELIVPAMNNEWGFEDQTLKADYAAVFEITYFDDFALCGERDVQIVTDYRLVQEDESPQRTYITVFTDVAAAREALFDLMRTVNVGSV